VIVAKQVKKTSGDGSVTIYEYAADVRTAAGAPFRATIQEPGISTNFWSPRVGDEVSVLVDAKRGKAKFDKDDPRLDTRARLTATKAAFEATAQQAPGTGVAGPTGGVAAQLAMAVQAAAAAQFAAPGAGDDPAQRLAKLDTMRQQGLITDEELAVARQRIIDAI
jgi:hypothetical protein